MVLSPAAKEKSSLSHEVADRQKRPRWVHFT
jgi:hypothetical protein